jgi:DNA polymerase-3 subunit delta
MATPAAVRTQIKAGQTDPLYLVLGDDSSEKSALAGEFAELVDEGLRAFNVERIYGDDSKPDDVKIGELLDAARTLPMMAPRRVVIVLRAERLLAPKRESLAAARALAALEAYLKAPEPHATVVFVADELDERLRATKLLRRHATIVDCGGIENAADGERWINARLVRDNVKMEEAAIRLIAARAGDDGERLRADLDRVLLYAAGEPAVTLADAQAVVGPATAQGEWGVTHAIERGAIGDALRELALLLDAGVVPYKILGQLAWFVRSRFPPMRLRPAIDALFRTDLDLKTSAGSPRVLLERLVVELCQR